VPDKVLLRVSFDATNRDGYVHNLYYNQNQGVVARESGRVSLTVTPFEDFKNTTVYELDQSGGNSAGDSLYSVNQCGESYHGIPLACSAAALFSPSLDQAIGVPGAWAAYLKANPKAYPGGITAFLKYIKQIQQGNFWDVDSVISPYHYGKDYYLANTTTYDVAPEVQLKNIFGYSGSNFHDNVSETGNPYLVQATQDFTNGYSGNRIQENSLSDELQAQGKLFDNSLTYIVGAYYQDLDTYTFYPQTYFNIPPILNATGFQSNFYNDDTTEAIFAQGTYDLSRATGVQGLSFTGGYRYTWEQLKEHQLPGSDDYGIGESSQHLSFSNPSWTVELSYQMNPDLLFYIEGRRSWRSGGINGVAPQVNANAAGAGDFFGSEYTRDVEAGMKFGGLVLGHPATLNIALYNQWIDNVQRAEFPTVGGHSIAVTINVPSAEVSGIEADASIQPVDWLHLGASGALTDPRFTSGNALIFGTEYVFDSYADTPRASGDIYATVDLPVADNIGLMSIRGDIYGQTGQYFSNNNFSIIPGTALPGYGLVNLRYDWHAIFGTKLSFAAFVNNLLNKGYYVGGLAQGASLGLNAVALGYPQMFGVEFRYNF
jgi:iron complex outermembrane receptor protein